MKRAVWRFCTLAAALVTCLSAAAQVAFDEIRETPAKGYGVYYVTEFPAATPDVAPKGYEQVYLSTYARHGARYILSEKMYTDIHTTLDKAHRGRLLTPAGEDFYRRFEAVYPQLKGRSGFLTPLGSAQHKAFGKRLYAQNPAFWKHRPHIEARSTNLPRVILSMNACLEGLKEGNPALRWNATCAKAEMGYLNPHSGLKKDYEDPKASSQYRLGNTAVWQEGMMAIFREKVDCGAFIRRYFTNGSIVEDPEGFMLFCYYLAGDMYSIPELETYFDDLFTQEDILGIWEADNYLYYSQKGPDPLYSGRGMEVAWEMLDDIIVKTDADLAEYPYAARLRFGHDGCMMALMAFMGIDRWGEVVPRDQVKDVWQTYKVPMASAFQFAFYRGKKSGDLIFKLSYNGETVTLPLPAVDFPYYSWEAFKAYYLPRIAAAKEHLANLDPEGRPYVLEGKVTCEGRPVEGVAVTDGVNIVRTDAEGRYRMASDKRQGLVYLSVPSGYRAVSTDGLQPDFYAHLTAAPEVKEVHDFTLVREDQRHYSVIFFPDAHLSNADFKPELESFRDIALPVIREQAALLSAEGPVYTMNLGDLSHDIYWYDYNFTLEDDYNFLRELPYPTLMYSVSGNHDNDPSITTDHTDFDSEHVFRKVFGPEHYSVNIGGDHWIMLDDIQYINVPGKGKKAKGVKGDRSYDKGLSEDAWHWLEQDVAGLPDGTPVRICVHSPIIYHNASGTLFSVGDARRLSDLLARFAPVRVYAGHVHHMHWLQREEWPVFREVDLPAVSGTMWTTRPNRVLSNQGEDAGILVGRYSGGAVEYTYQTYKHGDRAMRLYDMNAVAKRYAADKDIRALLAACPGRDDYAAREYRNYVYINYWMLRDGETVEALENGRPLEVEQVNDEDPLYLLNLHLPDFLESGKHSRGKVGNLHMFRAKAQSARTPVTVRVRNAAGEIVREAVLQRPGVFDENM
ncbi:MAG: calcineurin-like phosphoesterase C-terminal domain-containing protein [Bacteroidales bacterium]|nr:calcineurin-like phosphoesterase C-terminal domain-containing protein [Bacteroidales bacterium]